MCLLVFLSLCLISFCLCACGCFLLVKWCGHCKNMAPHFKRAAKNLRKKRNDVIFAKVFCIMRTVQEMFTLNSCLYMHCIEDYFLIFAYLCVMLICSLCSGCAAQVDATANPMLKERYKISGYPTLHLFHGSSGPEVRHRCCQSITGCACAVPLLFQCVVFSDWDLGSALT